MKWRTTIPTALVLAGALIVTAAPASAQPNQYDRSNPHGNQFIMRAEPAVVNQIAVQYGLAVVGGAANEEDHLTLVEGPVSMTAAEVEALVSSDPDVRSFTRVVLATLPGIDEGPGLNASENDILDELRRVGEYSIPSCLTQGFTAGLWVGYADQRAARRIDLHAAHGVAPNCGAATVAIIDTGVDPDHPLLVDALVPGYDFLTEQYGVPSEWNNLDQSVSAIVEQSVSAIVEQSVSAIVEGQGQALVMDASMAPVLDSAGMASLQGIELPPFFGHGTMVAGLVRLAAPGAAIMPLRAFDGNGRGHLFDIVRAVYYAVDHGADVINMSFSMETISPELLHAVNYARNRGVVCVAAAGNRGQKIIVYPAAFGSVVGVASTTHQDTLAEFSNYGPGLAALGAPGVGLISTYPGGLYAAGWGTSFSAPLVTGTVALIHSFYPEQDSSACHRKVNALTQGAEKIQDLAGLIRSGRLDALGTVEEVGGNCY